MSLLPVLKLLDIAQDASTITVVDATGDYNVSTNPRGFGTPNPEKEDVTGILLTLYSFNNVKVGVTTRLASTANILSTGEVLPASKFPGITTGSMYPDSVYGLKYQVAYDGPDSIGYTGTKQFTLTDADSVFITAVGFVLSANPSKIYYIDRTRPLNTEGGYVTETLPATGSDNYEIIYEGDLKLLVDKAGDKCLTEDIGIWADEGCKDDNFKDIWTRFKQRIAMRNKFTQGYLNDAHKLAINLSNYCDCNTPYQTCNC